MTAPLRLVLYGKPRCSLCDHAREQLEDLLDELDGAPPASLACVDVTQDPALLARYRHDVPVLSVDGRDAFRHRFDPARLRDRIVSGRPGPLEEPS